MRNNSPSSRRSTHNETIHDRAERLPGVARSGVPRPGVPRRTSLNVLPSLRRLAGVAALLVAAFGPPLAAQLQVVERVSVSSTGEEANGFSSVDPTISDDGRYVAFSSTASNLVPDDTNNRSDVFLRDRLENTTTRCSVGPGGVQADDDCRFSVISGDGRWVAFMSESDLLDPADQNGNNDVYVYEVQTGALERISVDEQGGDGNGASSNPSISDDGRFVGFSSSSSDLVPGDTNNTFDIFLRDRDLGTTTRVNLPAGPAVQTNGISFTPRLSADGRTVAFITTATNMGTGDTGTEFDVYVRDTVAGTTVQASLDAAGQQVPFFPCNEPVISGDARYVAFTCDWPLVPEDSNGDADIFLRDLVNGTTERISTSSLGQEAVFEPNLGAAISHDGRYVSWWSRSFLFLDADTNDFVDTYVRDRVTGVVELVTSRADGGLGDGESNLASMSADGRYFAYLSTASNLVPGDTNGLHDIFVIDRRLGRLALSILGDQAGGTARIVLSGGTPNAVVLLGFSTGPQALTGSPWGLLSLDPVFEAAILSADGGGRLVVPVVIPAGFAGVDVWLQAVEGTSGLLSNAFLLDVQ